MNMKKWLILVIVGSGLCGCNSYFSDDPPHKTQQVLNSGHPVRCVQNQKPVKTIKHRFDGDLQNVFLDSSRWPSEFANIEQGNGEAKLVAASDDTTDALEAWKLYKTPMPYNKSWQISVDIRIPHYWDHGREKEAQVGAGLFVGKPVKNGISSKVYETNFAVISDQLRFAQAQLIKNRLGEDPIDVDYIELDRKPLSIRTMIQFCHHDKTLSYFVNGKQVGKAQAIDASGMDNWQLTEKDRMDVGIMGFAENTQIKSHSPGIDNFIVRLF